MNRSDNFLLAILFALSSPFTLLLTLVMAVPAALYCKKKVLEDNRFAYVELDRALTYARWSSKFYGQSHSYTVEAYAKYKSLIHELNESGLLDEEDLEVWSLDNLD